MAITRVSAVVVDDSGLQRKLKYVTREVMPEVQKLSVNELMKSTMNVERQEMRNVFDRPTPWVLRSLRVAKWARSKDPTGAVWFKDRRQRSGFSGEEIVRPHIDGGGRKPTSSERKLRQRGVLRHNEWLIAGSGAPRNKFGNVKPGMYNRLLSFYRAGGTAKQTRRGFRFFIADAGAGRAIYQVEGKKGRPRLMWYVTSSAPRYRRRFRFYYVAQRHARFQGPRIGDEAKRKALSGIR